MPKQALQRRINWMLARQAGGLQRPAFFDIDQTYPALRVLDRNQDAIREELEEVLRERESIPRYHEVSKVETHISATVDPEKSWRVFMLATVDGAVPANAAKCHRTVAALQQVLIVDVLRPMPLHYRLFNLFLTRVLGRCSEEVKEIRSNLRKFA